MANTSEWVLLLYRLPREPSGPRVAVWRRLRRLGVAQLTDGVVALPRSESSQEQLEWVAEAVTEANGVASVWLARPSASLDERPLIDQMSTAVAEEYRRVAAEAATRPADPMERRRTVRRLRRRLREITGRDHFGSAERTAAQRAVESLAAAAEVGV